MNDLTRLTDDEVVKLIKAIKPKKHIDFKGVSRTYSVAYNVDDTYAVESDDEDGIYEESEDPETICTYMREAEWDLD